jgi:hypothetical protein
MDISMARTEARKKILVIGVVILLFLLGGFTAYFIFKGENKGLFIKSSFKNPVGPPSIKGPSGPPPVNYDATESSVLSE